MALPFLFEQLNNERWVSNLLPNAHLNLNVIEQLGAG